ncbi:MAG TPA: nickel-responsive transcriptional regulator NikR [Stellaceae bacterium]|nr:nickel-responsive transcriptional regulator NikR [Stellaceae bacterium]
MQRITVTIDDELLAAIDRVIAERGYQNRSEAIRDLARAGMTELEETAATQREGVAALVYVYDHEGRELAKRLTRSFHDHHDLSLATMHVHLDHESCLEVAVLRGGMDDIRHFAEHVISERGVRHGRLVAVPVELSVESHPHGGDLGRRHVHTHVREAG